MKHHDATNAIHEDNPRPDNPPEVPVDANEAPAENMQDTQPIGTSPLEKQAREYLEGWQRERSEFANYKKRIEREMKDIAANAAAGALMSLLPIIDDFERAFASLPEDLKDNPWMNGVSGIHRKFQKILDDQSITVIDPVGEIFDPTRHEAVGMEDSDTVESGHVTTTLQKGYARGEKVLRPALVKVAN